MSRPTAKSICNYCGKIFDAQIRFLNKGEAKYCSRSCASYGFYKNKPKPKPNVECAWCNKLFYKTASRIKASKSGLFFCCREHKDLAQRIDGIKAIHPKNYSNGKSIYRDKAFRNKKAKCEKCGYERHKQCLQVHHIDHNRDNNDISNLQILCLVCHAEHHLGLETI